MIESFFALRGSTLFYGLIGGIVPALFWLWFWLREDAQHPEPRELIFWAFVLGGLATFIVLPFEWLATIFFSGPALLVAWATIEEVIKYEITHFSAFKNQAFDEPVDALVYLITVALGFAALENVFFIIRAFQEQGQAAAILIGNMRFVGSTLLHIVASSAIGALMGLTFHQSPRVRRLATFLGILAAIVLHSYFNFFILQAKNGTTLATFVGLWAAVIVLLVFFEKIKRRE